MQAAVSHYDLITIYGHKGFTRSGTYSDLALHSSSNVQHTCDTGATVVNVIPHFKFQFSLLHFTNIGFVSPTCKPVNDTVGFTSRVLIL